MTTVQQWLLPAALAGRDVLAYAATGSGKTAAYIIPCLSAVWQYGRVTYPDAREVHPQPSVVIMCPMRELVYQVTAVAEDLLTSSGVVVCMVCSGINFMDPLLKGSDVVVGTLGGLPLAHKHEALQ